MDQVLFYLVPIFLLSSILYAMVGQGGASAYLAFMALFGVPHQTLPPIALTCNIIASAGIIYHFHRAGHIKLRLFWPFVATSVPAAFIGGMIKVSQKEFTIILAIVLFIISLKSFFFQLDAKDVRTPPCKILIPVGLIIGALIGLVAGMIGIGGGVLLLPVITLLKWGKAKEAAIAGGLFTLVNSVAALVGHGIRGTIDLKFLIPLAVAVAIGSQIGGFLGAKKFSENTIQKIFSFIILIIAVRLLINLF